MELSTSGGVACFPFVRGSACAAGAGRHLADALALGSHVCARTALGRAALLRALALIGAGGSRGAHARAPRYPRRPSLYLTGRAGRSSIRIGNGEAYAGAGDTPVHAAFSSSARPVDRSIRRAGKLIHAAEITAATRLNLFLGARTIGTRTLGEHAVLLIGGATRGAVGPAPVDIPSAIRIDAGGRRGRGMRG